MREDALRIALVCYPSAGGSGIVASELATGLYRRGHEVHVIASDEPHRGLPAGAGFHRVHVPQYPLFEHLPYALALAAEIVRVAQQHTLDVVHVHYAVPHAASAQLAVQALGPDAPAIVTTLHGTDVTVVGADPSLASIARATTRHSDALSVPSEFLKRQALKWLAGAAHPEIQVIANFVDTVRFAPAAPGEASCFDPLFGGAGAGEPVLVHVSNFRPIKRVGDALELLARVRTRRPMRLCLIGDGPERAGIERRAAQLGIAASVCFLGRQLAVEQYLRHADAFLLTSESEGFGLAALEALSCGVPVFGYAVGGLTEVVPDEAGRLAPAFDIAVLAERVLDALADPVAHTRMRQFARAHALAHFQSEPALDRYELLYRRTLAHRSPRRPR